MESNDKSITSFDLKSLSVENKLKLLSEEEKTLLNDYIDQKLEKSKETSIICKIIDVLV